MLRGIILLFFLGFSVAFGQERCGSAHKLLHQLKNNSKQQTFHNQLEKKIQKWSQNKRGGSMIEIPVVFHVVYKNASENISSSSALGGRHTREHPCA